jgi:hypothetical protein
MRIIANFGREKRPPAQANKSRQPLTLVPRGVAGDLVNHLSVIGLCCFKLRDTLGANEANTGAKQIEMIETAVQEAAELIKKIQMI